MKNDFVYALPGVIQSKDNRGSRNRLAKALRENELVKVLPGIYALAHLANDVRALAAAATLYEPNCILTGRVAAKLQFMADLKVDVVTASVDSAQFKIPKYAKFQFKRRKLPAELKRPWCKGFVVLPEVAVFQMAADNDFSGLCDGLRKSAVSIESLKKAEQKLKTCSRLRTSLCLEKAEGNPWSVAELEMQDVLRGEGINGWVGNRMIRVADRNVAPDIAFHERKVALEIDSEEFHHNLDSFHEDRARHNLLVAEGWIVLHATPRMVRERPEEIVEQLKAALWQR